LQDSRSASKEEKKVLVESLKAEWKQMWAIRYNDKNRAEGVAKEDYQRLNVGRGTVIHATRSYKALDFKEILKQNNIQDADRFIQPNKEVGGWTKFAKTEIIAKSPKSQRQQIKQQMAIDKEKCSKMRPKKGGRGWLHSA
jgi:hypothetical protein